MEELFQKFLMHLGSCFTQARHTFTQPRQDILEVLENIGMSDLFGLPRFDVGWSQSDFSRLSQILYEYNLLPDSLSVATVSRLECGSNGITQSAYIYAYMLGIESHVFPNLAEEVSIDSNAYGGLTHWLEALGRQFSEARHRMFAPRREIVEFFEKRGETNTLHLARAQPGWTLCELSHLSTLYFSNTKEHLSPSTIFRLECGGSRVTVRTFVYAYVLGLERLLFRSP